ncbi:Death on curing protein, Doc toxin [uncultured Candidatus Thioglobus sp.]|nr:Death on curing protein, Doc toxin [uncultured Candidatus Thioglobus sp.]
MSYQVRLTRHAREDIKRLYDFLSIKDVVLARRAFENITQAMQLLEKMPFSCRKASANDSLRELLISFGASGYVALFRIEDKEKITILAVRHQLEEDYY